MNEFSPGGSILRADATARSERPGAGALFHVTPLQDPGPDYDRLIAEAPVHWDPASKRFIVLGHAAARHVLRDEGFAVDRSLQRTLARLEQAGIGAYPHLHGLIAKFVIWLDPPEHDPMRRVLARVVARVRPAELREFADALASRLVRQGRARGRFDLVADFARQIPVAVLARMLDLPDQDHPALIEFAARLAAPILEAPLLPARIYRRLDGDAEAALAFFRERIEASIEAGRQDGLTMMAQATGNDERPDAAAALATFLILAGAELTANFIASAAMSLLGDPAWMAELRADPAAIPAAVETMLRHNPPIHGVRRVALETRVVDGVTIPAGSRVTLFLAAAHRDPACAPDAGTLTFGEGRHLCLGATQARIESQAAIAALLTLPAPRLDLETAEWDPLLSVRSLRRLIVHTGDPEI